MTITAKFPGTCPCCNGHINAGDKVEWSKGSKATHTSCSSGATSRSSSTAGRYPRRQLVNGDVYRSRRTGEECIFGCADCRRLGRMCRQCAFDNE